MSHCEHCRAQNGLIFLASAAESAGGHLNFTFRIQMDFRFLTDFTTEAFSFKSRPERGTLGTKGLTILIALVGSAERNYRKEDSIESLTV